MPTMSTLHRRSQRVEKLAVFEDGGVLHKQSTTHSVSAVILLRSSVGTDERREDFEEYIAGREDDERSRFH
jgi:hypothetical protein